jgi:DNA-binding Lrp family transcriptional regulator
MGQVTDRDIEMVNLLTENPNLSLDELGLKLGITKQAVAERKSGLEEEGFTKSFYFWNITPRFESTKRVLIEVEREYKKNINRILSILDRFNPVVVFFRTQPEAFFNEKVSSINETINEIEGILHFNNEKEEEQLRKELGELGIKDVSIEFILFSGLLGEKYDINLKAPDQVEEIARSVAEHLSSEASIQAVLYEQHKQPVDQFDLIIVRDERFQPFMDSYERRIKRTLIDYHFMNLRSFTNLGIDWLKNMKLVYT